MCACKVLCKVHSTENNAQMNKLIVNLEKWL